MVLLFCIDQFDFTMYVFYLKNYKFKCYMRKKNVTYKIFILFIFLVNHIETFPQRFSNKKISRIISKEKSLEGSSVAFSLGQLTNSKRIVNYNSDKLMTPGSNIKLLTLYMGLKNFDSFPTLNLWLFLVKLEKSDDFEDMQRRVPSVEKIKKQIDWEPKFCSNQ